MGGAPSRLLALLGSHLGGNAAAGPDLAMRMRIAGAHHLAAILEDLHVADVGQAAQVGVLRGPHVHHQREIRHAHARHGQIVPRRKAAHAADARLAGGDQQAVAILDGLGGRGRQQRRKIVIEDKRAGVRRIAHAARARIAGAKVAVGIVLRLRGAGAVFSTWPCQGRCGAVGRHQDPRSIQQIEAAVRVLREIEHRYEDNKGRMIR